MHSRLKYCKSTFALCWTFCAIYLHTFFAHRRSNTLIPTGFFKQIDSAITSTHFARGLPRRSGYRHSLSDAWAYRLRQRTATKREIRMTIVMILISVSSQCSSCSMPALAPLTLSFARDFCLFYRAMTLSFRRLHLLSFVAMNLR